MKLSTTLKTMRREAARLDAAGRLDEANTITRKMCVLAQQIAQTTPDANSQTLALVKRYVDWGRSQGMNKTQIYQHALQHESQPFAGQLAQYMDAQGLK